MTAYHSLSAMGASASRRPAPHCLLRATIFGLALAMSVVPLSVAHAQFGPPAPPDERSARERARIDITGQWVSVVNEDWRWRMVTPAVGDTASVPLNAAGQAAAMAWDLERDRANGDLCKAFGPPGLIRQPTRMRVSWEDDDTFLLEFDAGEQTRRLHFDEAPAEEDPSLQGSSTAEWIRQTQSRGVFGAQTPPTGGALEVVTTNMTSGYLRPNGVPYSDQATVREFFNTFTLPDGGAWLIIRTVVDDPAYLTQEFIITSQFKKEERRTGWNPRPCEISAPSPITESGE